jgi:uncharacterized protein
LKPAEAIAVFTKSPVAGEVKTRLLDQLSPAQAAEVQEACLRDTMRLAEAVPQCGRWLLVAPSSCPGAEPSALQPGDGWRRGWQRGTELGARLEAAFAELFRQGAGKVVAIGTDTPWMGRERIRRALDWLDRADFVLGPSLDGGYYLLGARRLEPAVFRAIPWGTRHVLLFTRRALERAGRSYRLLPVDFDLDRPEDLRRAAEILRADPSRAAHLARWLARWQAGGN